MDNFFKLLKETGITLPQLFFSSTGYNNGILESINNVNKYLHNRGNILDFGCGSGLTTYLLEKQGYRVKGIECINSENIELFKQYPELQKKLWDKIDCDIQFYDGETIPFEDNSFNGIFIHAVFEHLEDKSIIKEIHRVLKPGGYLFIFRTPDKNSWAENITKGHNQLLTKEEILSTLNDFTLIEFDKTDFLCWALPGRLQDIWNLMFPILNIIDKIILKTPLKKYAHNFKMVFKKC